MAKLSGFLEENKEVKKKDTLPSISAKWIHYSKLTTGKFQYRDKGKTEEQLREEAIDLSVSIELAGRLLEYPLVRKIDVDEYEIISGHTRVRACRYLAEELGKKEFEFVPCHVQNLTDEDADYFTTSGNIRKASTQAEILHEIENERKRADKISSPEDKGRLVERLARKYGMAPSVVGDYINISNNLSDKGRELLEEGKLKKSAAVALSSLPDEEQDKLITEGVTAHKDIKRYKEENLQKTVHRTTITDTVKTISTHNVNAPEPEPIDVLPGQYKVANTDMELVEEKEAASPEEKKPEVHPGICECPTCKRTTRIEDTFSFYNKKYCMNCLYDLLLDLADTGVITIISTDAESKGNIVKS